MPHASHCLKSRMARVEQLFTGRKELSFGVECVGSVGSLLGRKRFTHA
jgi:hypothetical protein